jgi:hypothetical protein
VNEKINRAVPPLALMLSALPILIGLGLHFRATSRLAESFRWSYETDWWFVVVMLVVAVFNRVSAHLFRHTAPRWAAVYLFFSAASLIVAAAGLLREVGLIRWTDQAPLLMLIPIGYLIASRLWRGQSPERPLLWVAQAATAVILVHGLWGSVALIESAFRPIQREAANLLLGLVFAEASLFYTLAAVFHRRSANGYFAAAAACAALWQLLGYWGVAGAYYTMLYACLGVVLLAVCRLLGIEQMVVYRPDGTRAMAVRGRGRALFQSGNAVLSIALLAAVLQGLARLATHASGWLGFWALAWTMVASALAVGLVPQGAWRRVYTTATIALGGLVFLTLNVLIQLTAWQKLEIFCLAVGVLLVGASYVGRFRESGDRRSDMVTAGLWLGSLLATLPLVTAVLYYRFPGGHISLINELGLLAVTILLLVTGYSWQIKSTTFAGATALTLYLMIIVVSLGWRQQVAVGVYLAIGGLLVFASGIALSVYREKLLALPDQFARREGLFRVMTWR